MPQNHPRGGYIAFHNGALLPDNILDWIIDAALRGKMTKSGANLLLLPDTRNGSPDTFGLYRIGRFRKSDCLTLKQLIRKLRRSPNRQKPAQTGEKI